jgi:hypothetical protein
MIDLLEILMAIGYNEVEVEPARMLYVPDLDDPTGEMTTLMYISFI